MQQIISEFTPFKGQHCETTATGSLLKQVGIELSEAMLFGLGEGLGFIFWNMKQMDFPFIGGRVKQDHLTRNLAANLNLELNVRETTSLKKAWKNVKEPIDNGQAVGLKLDCYYLDYFTQRHHFAGHYVAMYGYDSQSAYLVDTGQQGGGAKTSLKSLEAARNARGPMSSRNLSYTLVKSGREFDLNAVIILALKNNARDFLNPPIKNIGYQGILKTSKEIKKWFALSEDIERDFKTTAMLMEKAGTGGSLFRNFFRDFLAESHALLRLPLLLEAHEYFSRTAALWTQVAGLFQKTGETCRIKYINQASDLLIQIARIEQKAMELLSGI